MADALLITFGCSWTFGVGVCYEPGMSRQEMETKAWDHEICDASSWRGLLSQRFNLANINRSQGGSSNQKQFRLATEFFGSRLYQECRQKFSRIIVIWGITSTARSEIWSLKHNGFHNFFLSDDADDLSRFIGKHCYDHDASVAELRNLMLFWNVFFEGQHIKNYWFDTFNTHNYTFNFHENQHSKTYGIDPHANDLGKKRAYEAVAGPDWPSYSDFCEGNLDQVTPEIIEEITSMFAYSGVAGGKRLPTVSTRYTQHTSLDPIPNLLDHDCWPRDLLSWLMRESDIPVPQDQQSYHHSAWNIDRKGMELLVEQGILNPYSHHPTKKGHNSLCDYFTCKLGKELNING